MLIVEAGYTWVTDLGRFRGPHLGFSVNGALDQYSAAAANLLVGNAESLPVLESTARPLVLTAEQDVLVAVTGAPGAVRVDGILAASWTPVSLRRGQTIEVGASTRGVRRYLAVRGGFEAPMLLGSCAPDSMLQFGRRLEDGSRVQEREGTPPLRHPVFELPVMRFTAPAVSFDDVLTVPVTDGPDFDEFGDAASLLYDAEFVVDARSNHVGLRLSGHSPVRQTQAEVLSRGVPVGAIEVPSQEGLLLLHRGRGVTAGYPVLAVATTVGLDIMAQAVPGQRVRFRRQSLTEAREAFLQRALQLTALGRTARILLGAHGVDPLSEIAAQAA
jgi:biotin-dependent carboxylase-like uncharacterized protein